MSEKDIVLTAEDLDTIGEIMNISMGSAATAVSTMLEKQVTITTPILTQDRFGSIDSSDLEPALIVKIKYVEGIEGTNVIMLRRRDIQIILDLLMGNEFTGESEDFEFDDMSMSAACEVMNQMMGASATAISEILGIPINISTPEASLVETKAEIQEAFCDINTEEQVVAISFKMMIKDIVDTTFSCFLTTSLAERIIAMVSGDSAEEPEAEPVPQELPAAMPAPVDTAPVSAASVSVAPPPAVPAPAAAAPVAPPPAPTAPVSAPVAPVPSAPAPAAPPPAPAASAEPVFQPISYPTSQPVPERVPMQFETQPVPATPQATPQTPPVQQAPPMQQMPGAQQMYPYGMPPNPQMPYPPQPNPYGGYYQPPQGLYPPQQNVNLQSAEFPDFSRQMYAPVTPSGSSMGLLMGVQLEVSVVIGRTKRKIKDIMEFGQGTVLELDKQTGAPAEIMVNGQLLAYGDVIVVGDNFGVRVTEIVGTKDLLESLDSGK